jgi:hypothetical protein
VGAPMVVGPLLAAALVVATYVLARELCLGDERLENQVVPVSLLAVALSVVCAALRYHTADTMAHGASALGITVALATALRGRRTGELPWFAFAGFAVGWVVSTRIVSALPIGAVVLALAAGASARPRALGVAAAGMLPGILVLLLAQHATTGHWLASTQRAYYATSDGPPGCFRYGFGSGIGCLYEHGDFVRAHLTHGYGLVAALGTTLRRLRMHLLDVANFEPLALLVFLPFASGFRRRRGALFALVVVLGQVLVYAPFYFDGNYPGGGARLFADALPIEHVLIAVGVASVLPFVPLLRRGLVLVAIALLGFSVHAVHDHLALQKRDGGRPLYEPDVAHDNQVTHGLVFFDNDAAFNLAYDPTAEPSHVALAARQRNDDHDRLLYEHLGRPPTYAYRFGAESSSISVWVPTVGTNDDFWRFEAESDWPPLAQQGGWAEPAWASGTCASGEHVLTVHPVPETGTSSATIELPAPRAGSWLVTPRVMRRGGHGKGKLRLLAKGQTPLEWTWNDGDARDACNDLPPQEAPLSLEGARLEVTAAGGAVALDRTNLRWLQPPKGTR